MMVKIKIWSFSGFACLLWGVLLLLGGATGCQTSPENYEELTQDEQKILINEARSFAISSKKLDDFCMAGVAETSPIVRIVYSGDKEGKAECRWEIYQPSPDHKFTQESINPVMVRVYAEGALTRSPTWRIVCARQGGRRQNSSTENQTIRVSYGR